MPSVMTTSLSDALKTLSQILAVFCVAFIVGMVAHKGHADISALAQKHSGERFWVALAKYFIGNLAGGGSPTPRDSSGDVNGHGLAFVTSAGEFADVRRVLKC